MRNLERKMNLILARLFFGEEKEHDKRIATENVSDVADRAQSFASFLTVTRKFHYGCIFNIHIICPKKVIAKLILSQTRVFDIFPTHIYQSSNMNILFGNFMRETSRYIPKNSLWLNRLF